MMKMKCKLCGEKFEGENTQFLAMMGFSHLQQKHQKEFEGIITKIGQICGKYFKIKKIKKEEKKQYNQGYQ